MATKSGASIFGLWSVHANPIITISSIFVGNDGVWKSLVKISSQLIGGICAGFVVYFMVINNLKLNTDLSDASVWHIGEPTSGLSIPWHIISIDGQKDINDAIKISWYWIVIFIVEFTGLTVMLWAIFNTKHDYKKIHLLKNQYIHAQLWD